MIQCLKCLAPVGHEAVNSNRFVECTECGTPARTDVYPAALRAIPSAESPERIITEDDAGCFYHPKKQATTHCDACGRFLCSLCDVEMDGGHICFSCMESGKKKKTLKNLENTRTLYDSLALWVSLIPLTFVFWFTVIFTAPASLFMVFRYWNAPSGLIPRTKIRFVAAFILSLGQIIGCGIIVYFMVSGIMNS